VIARLRRHEGGEAGFTLVELLVAAALGVVVMGGVVMLVVGAVRYQPKISKEAENVSSARWILERLTHELRNGISIKEGTATRISFEGYVRHSTCGGSAALAAGSPSIICRITWECSTTACTRRESSPAAPGTGTAKQVFSGLSSNQVFTFVPNVAAATYVKATLRLTPADPAGQPLVISSGASLRNATLGY
jgi:type II secretory pathway pseudopilin PulG